MADAKVSSERLNEAFRQGVDEVQDIYLVYIKGSGDKRTVSSGDLYNVIRSLVATLAVGDELIIEKTRERKIITHDHAVHDHDDDDAPEAEVINVERD